MNLKVKVSGWSAGFPVVMLNKKTAKKLGFHLSDRILIKTTGLKKREFSSIVDTTDSFVKEDEIIVSLEVIKTLNLKDGQKVDVSLSDIPVSINFIKKKMDGEKLTKNEISRIIKDIVNNTLSQPEIAVFISAMYKTGMDFDETIFLIDAILGSGEKLNLRKKYIADKHCIGGVPGNRTTPIIISICACAGLTLPKTSSRAITSAAGTADVIETIANIDFNMKDIKKIVNKTNACLVWGGGLGMVPADSKIIKVEKALKLDPEAQLLASIISKKLAVGSKYLLIDIPYGKGAKVSKKKALRLKRKFLALAKHFNMKMQVALTKGDRPIGKGIGPVLELMDVLDILDPKKIGPKDLEEKSLLLSGKLLEMTEKAKKGKGYNLAKEILYSGKALKKFKEIIKAQKGSFENIKFAKFKTDILSERKGKIKAVDNKKINSLARVAGCPVDKASGIYLHKSLHEKVKKQEKIITIYAESRSRLNKALRYFEKNKFFEIR
jgi:AMP phosphorylase